MCIASDTELTSYLWPIWLSRLFLLDFHLFFIKFYLFLIRGYSLHIASTWSHCWCTTQALSPVSPPPSGTSPLGHIPASLSDPVFMQSPWLAHIWYTYFVDILPPPHPLLLSQSSEDCLYICKISFAVFSHTCAAHCIGVNFLAYTIDKISESFLSGILSSVFLGCY